jgi:glucose/arabinose dehydrogenase
MWHQGGIVVDASGILTGMRRSSLPVAIAAGFVMAACGSDNGDARTAADEPLAPGAGAPEAPAPGADHGDRDAGAAQGRGVRLVSVGRFSSPLFVTAPPGDRRRIFVVEQGGRIVVVRGGRRLARPFLDIRSLVTAGGEQGLLGLAFAPDYARSRRFYVYYTDRAGEQRVVEYRRATADRAAPGSARLVLQMADPEGNHNGGMLAFGPDRLLYIGTGDGGGANDQHGRRGNGQDLGSLLAKLLRIDPRAAGGRAYTSPSGNPFTGRSGARPEIYSYGLRNPWRFSFDRRTGDLSIGDVGQNAVEEIDFVRRGRGRGANFGWRPFEGSRRNFPDESAPGHVGPVIEQSHGDGWCSITGGYVVRDRNLPALAGRYVYGDFCLGRIRSAQLRAGGAAGDRALDLRQVPSLSSFGEDARGRVYVTSLEGPVYRLSAR